MNIATDGLAVDRVHVWRGDRHVLQGVSAQIGRGQLLHVSGPNGTGKTTLLRVVSGLLRPEQGSVTWQGQSIVSHRTDYQAALAYAAHEPALKGDLTALENLRFSVGLKRRCQKWCEYFNYANRALELITGKKEKFVVTDPSAIQL